MGVVVVIDSYYDSYVFPANQTTSIFFCISVTKLPPRLPCAAFKNQKGMIGPE